MPDRNLVYVLRSESNPDRFYVGLTTDVAKRLQRPLLLVVRYVNIRHMKRTTIYLEPDLELLLERETRKRGQPMAALIREALREHLTKGPVVGPPGAGAFSSGRRDTAANPDAVLTDTGFGETR